MVVLTDPEPTQDTPLGEPDNASDKNLEADSFSDTAGLAGGPPAGMRGRLDGIRRLTGLPAERLGLRDRGTLAEGSAADVVVLDLDGMRDTSTFENPTVYAEGIEHVLVNGAHVFADGDRTGVHGGRVLRATG